MSIQIRDQLVTSRDKTWSGRNRCTSITVHETANTSQGANAQAHANLQSGGNVRQASWHIQVDDTEAIRSFPDTVRCWHAGRSAEDSIAIEICVNSDGDYYEALVNASKVVRKLREIHNLSREDVKQHFDWTGKHCPARLRSEGLWDAFLELTDPISEDIMTPQQEAKLDKVFSMMEDGTLARQVARELGWYDSSRKRNRSYQHDMSRLRNTVRKMAEKQGLDSDDIEV